MSSFSIASRREQYKVGSPMKRPVELVSWEAGAEMLCPGNPPHRKTMKRWFARERVSPVVRLSSKKSALNAVVLRQIIEQRARCQEA
jgi:hypothetical protein